MGLLGQPTFTIEQFHKKKFFKILMQQNISMGYKQFFTFIFLFICLTIQAQTGIGTTTPSASAKLEVASTTQGFLPPRLALTP